MMLALGKSLACMHNPHHGVAQGIPIKLPAINEELSEELFLTDAPCFKLDPGGGMLGLHQILEREPEELRHLMEERISHERVL